MVVFKIPTWNIRQNIGFFCFWKFLTSVMYSCSRFFWYLFLPHTLTRHGLLTGPDHQLPTYRTWSSITYLQDLIINYKLPLQWNSPVPWEKESLQIWSEKSTTVQNGQLTRCNSDNLYPTPPPKKRGGGGRDRTATASCSSTSVDLRLIKACLHYALNQFLSHGTQLVSS